MAEVSDSSLQFFSKATPKQWTYVFGLYKDVLKLKAAERNNRKGGPEELIKLDTWFQEQLPKIIHSRKDPHILHEELVQVTRWKLMRGKFRPRLIDLVRINTETAVTTVSKKAFRKLSKKRDLSSAINALATLKGVGPATASAILAAAYPEIAPYMADESMLATPGVEATDYTLAEYVNFVEQINQCVERLKAADAEAKWNPHKVEMALWTHYLAKELNPSLLDELPAANGTVKSAPTTTTEEDENEEKKHTANGNGEAAALLDENSLSAPPSETFDEKSSDSSPAGKNGGSNVTPDTTNEGYAFAESDNSNSRPLGSASAEESCDGNVDEPLFKKQRTDSDDVPAPPATAEVASL